MLTTRLAKPADLTTDDWSRWDALQRSNPLLESPYFRPEFTQAVAAIRDDVEIAVMCEGDKVVGYFPFQRDGYNVGRPVGGKLSDFQGPIAEQGTKIDLSRLVRQCKLACWDFEHLVMPSGTVPAQTFKTLASPYIDLSQGYDVYVARRKEAGTEIFSRTAQKARKMEREIGAVTFDYDATHDRAAFDMLMGWKSKQLTESGLVDLFQMPWTSELVFDLAKRRDPGLSGQLCVLRHQGRPISAGFWIRSSDVMHCWFIAYDPELSKYSPGIIMFTHLFRHAAEDGVTRIHLGAGDERYKWSLASASVDVSIGSIEFTHPITLTRRAWRFCRDNLSKWNTGWLGGQVATMLSPVRRWWAYR